MPSTTVQVDTETHKALKKAKKNMTFDELFRLYLDLVPPAEIERARKERDVAYAKWQEATAARIRSNRKNKRLF
ncbi:MAG TPA: hypothetical protein VM370_13260 [Candidatus Thermoplasmatota archaeon]|nr:hypothetical protein [Candidatus Thermoplasmatota archaeon]